MNGKKYTHMAGLFLMGLSVLGCGSDDADDSGSKSNVEKSQPMAQKSVEPRKTESVFVPPLPAPAPAKGEQAKTQPPKQPAAKSPTVEPAPGNAVSLDQELAKLQIPPAWLADVQPRYNTSKPWKDARLEIRRLLGQNREVDRKEAIKLTWIYLQKDDIGNGHEYPMYLFLGNEPVWAIRAYEEWLKKPHENTPVFGYKALAALYARYGKFDEAKSRLDHAMKNLPAPPWHVMREAEFHEAFGDLYLLWGKIDLAKQHYARSAQLYPTARPKYGRHLLPRRAAKVQTKLDLLSFRSLKTATLKDGIYRFSTLGYSGDVRVNVTIRDGRIAAITVQHKEKIEQNATKIIPQRIITKQSLEVDGVSGATVTKDAIVTATLRALKQAGLK